MGTELAHAVERASVESPGAVGLRLQADTHVLYGRREEGVGDAGEGARGEVLRVGEGVGGGVASLKPAAGLVEGAELDRDAGADA